MTRRRRRTPVPALAALALAAVLYLAQHAARHRAPTPDLAPETHAPATPPQAAPAPAPDNPARGNDDEASRPANDNALVARLYAERRSNVMVEVAVQVERTLRDDTQGSPHQKFLVRVNPDLTLLVAHNIGLAPRVPVRQGSSVRIRGEYEWNTQGGVLHWTHRDPGRRHQDGWIEFEGRRYQ